VENSVNASTPVVSTDKQRRDYKLNNKPQDTTSNNHKILFADERLSELAREFLGVKFESGLKAASITNYLQTFRAFSFVYLKDFDRRDLTEWLAEQTAEKNWTKQTFANRVRQLYALNRWLFYQSACLRLHRPPKVSMKPKRRELPTKHEWIIFFDSLRERFEQSTLGRRKSRWRDYVLCRIMFETGMRVGEAARLRVGDLTIYDEENFWIFTDGEKGEDAERACPISEKLCEEIRTYLWTFKIQNKKARMFTSKTGKDLDTTEFSKWLKQYALDLELSADLTPHVFRYKFIIDFISVGGSALELQARLGHADIKMTVYYFNQVRRLMPFVKTNPDISIVNKRSFSRAKYFQKRTLSFGDEYDD
jgi:site-specific recombinase XerD